MIVTKTLRSISSKKDFDCWRSQLNCGTHRDSLVKFTPLGVTTQESPAFRHGECQAQEALKLEHEKRKKEKKVYTRQQRDEMKERKRELRLQKAKAKHRGK
ncbi:DUF2992 family protein [Brevibacillus brevis]|nr:DUF2992 family protein [Brevibacillus brevis]